MDAVRAAAAAALDGAQRGFVGFSGGLDSTVLLHAAASVAPQLITAVHVNHALHPAADAWEAHCRRIAGERGVSFVSRRVDPGGGAGVEARARRARYAAFEPLLAQPGGVLLLAHHRGDQVETVLLRLLRGRGAYGMPAARPLGAGQLRRPLLGLPRSALADYAAAHRLDYLQDPGNADPAMDRNFLRHQVLPLLRERFDDVDGALLAAAAAGHAADAERAAALGEALAADRLPLALLRGADDAVGRLRLWLAARIGTLPTGAALVEFLRQALEAAADREPQLTVGSLAVRRYRQDLHLVAPPPDLAERYDLALPGRLTLPHGVLEVAEESAAGGAGFHPQGSVVVTFRRRGERLRAGGVDKPLKQWFQEAGVPPWARGTYPLLRDAAGLLAVPGIARRDVRQGATGPAFRASWRPFAASGGLR